MFNKENISEKGNFCQERLWQGKGTFSGNSPLLRRYCLKTLEKKKLCTQQKINGWHFKRKVQRNKRKKAGLCTMKAKSYPTHFFDYDSNVIASFPQEQDHLSREIVGQFYYCQSRLSSLEDKIDEILKYLNPYSRTQIFNEFQKYSILNHPSNYEMDCKMGSVNFNGEHWNESGIEFDNSRPSDFQMTKSLTYSKNKVGCEEGKKSHERYSPDSEKIPFHSESPVVHCLRMLSMLEEYLGSLGPRVLELLGKVIFLEKTNRKDLMSLLQKEEVFIFFELVKEKLRAQLSLGAMEEYLIKICQCILKDIDSMLTAYPFKRKLYSFPNSVVGANSFLEIPHRYSSVPKFQENSKDSERNRMNLPLYDLNSSVQLISGINNEDTSHSSKLLNDSNSYSRKKDLSNENIILPTVDESEKNVLQLSINIPVGFLPQSLSGFRTIHNKEEKSQDEIADCSVASSSSLFHSRNVTKENKGYLKNDFNKRPPKNFESIYYYRKQNDRCSYIPRDSFYRNEYFTDDIITQWPRYNYSNRQTMNPYQKYTTTSQHYGHYYDWDNRDVYFRRSF